MVAWMKVNQFNRTLSESINNTARAFIQAMISGPCCCVGPTALEPETLQRTLDAVAILILSNSPVSGPSGAKAKLCLTRPPALTFTP